MPAAEFLHAEAARFAFPGPLLAIHGISFDIPRGQFVSVVGPSGCGKSTLLRLLAGLLKPTGGTLAVDAQDAAQARRSGSRLALVFQEATLLPWRTVEANVALPLELTQVPKASRAGLVHKSLETVGLLEFRSRRPRELSGGMRMRAALARALVTSPDVLLLDEPFGALDDISRHELNEELFRLWESRRFTAVFVTHNIGEAVFLSERVLVMSRRPGRIVADVPVPLGNSRAPQLRATPEYGRLVGQVSDELRRACA